MTRRKVKLAFIVNDAARKAKYNEMRKGLMKKLAELTTLCDIDACAILYGPYDTNPEVWPNPLGVHRVLSYFRTMPAMDQGKKMLNQESFLKERITKACDQLKKQQKENREMEVRNLIAQVFTGRNSVENFSLDDLYDVNWVVDQRQKEVDFRLKGIADAEDEAAKKGKSVEALRIQKESEKQPLFMDMLKGLPETELNMEFGGEW